MFVTEYPPCDCNEEHTAVSHCPACEENFCADCDVMIHERKKNKTHVREPIELQPEEEEPEPEVEQEPVPCDSDARHIAVMYCEDCEENFCGDCDYAFHSRKKTANHSRFEGARRPEDIEALKLEAELEAQQAAAAAAGGAAPAAAPAATPAQPAAATQQKAASSSAPAGAASASYAAVAAAGAASAAAPTAAASAATPSAVDPAAAAAAATAADGKPKKTKKSKGPSSEERVAEHKAAWDERRKAICKTKYNVGHWLGLTTEDRKELAQALCAELLFNPQPSKTKGMLVTVEWSAASYWTTYEIDVTCTKTTVERRKKTATSEARIATSITVYSVHVDDMGRLASFDITVNGEAQGGCSIM